MSHQRTRGVFFRGGVAYIRYQDAEGRLVRESTRQGSRKVAEAILAKRKSEVAMGLHYPTRAFEQIRFKELADFWWEQHGKHTNSYFKYVLPRVLATFGSKKARNLRASVLREFLTAVADTYSPSYANCHRTVLNSIFSFAMRHKKYDDNQITLIPQFKEHERERLVEPEEFTRLLKACRKDTETKAFIVLAATTGCRKSELLARKWIDVCLTGSYAHLRVGITKNGDR